MTNREYLNTKTSKELTEWLEDSVAEAPKTEETDWAMFKSFSPSEFVCSCGKCEYSTPNGVKNMNPHLLTALQFLRNYYGKPVVITCGWRDKTYNDSLVGSIPNSKHLTGDAADFYIQGVTSTESGRDGVVKILKAMPKYNYAYHNKNGQFKNMGSAVHGDFLR